MARRDMLAQMRKRTVSYLVFFVGRRLELESHGSL